MLSSIFLLIFYGVFFDKESTSFLCFDSLHALLLSSLGPFVEEFNKFLRALMASALHSQVMDM